MPKQVFDAHFQRRGRARAPDTGALEAQVNDPAFKSAIHDVTTIHRNRRPNTRIKQLLDLRHDLVVFFRASRRRIFLGEDDRFAGVQMRRNTLGDDPSRHRFQTGGGQAVLLPPYPTTHSSLYRTPLPGSRE